MLFLDASIFTISVITAGILINTREGITTVPAGAAKEFVVGMDTSNYPVEMVSWNDAAEFCAKLSELEDLKPYYLRVGETIKPLDGTGYRLPTEAEWEFSCRAGTIEKYWISDNDDDLLWTDWFAKNSRGVMHAVGELRANPLGLKDVHGSVAEWVQDSWLASYYEQSARIPAINPQGPYALSFSPAAMRVNRGGSWGVNSACCRSSSRLALEPTACRNGVGFRVAMVIHARTIQPNP